MGSVDIDYIVKRLEEMYGDDLPNPISEPLQFAYVLKLFKYYGEKDDSKNEQNGT